MSLETSLIAANEVVNTSNVIRLQLECSCGWWTYEDRSHVHERVRQHFVWDDAEDWEDITITEAPNDPSA